MKFLREELAVVPPEVVRSFALLESFITELTANAKWAQEEGWKKPEELCEDGLRWAKGKYIALAKEHGFDVREEGDPEEEDHG